MNGLDDAAICAALYRASQAGVKIQLIVRGICRIRPGIPGLSENIRVISIIGRFLEHHRAFRFENDGNPEFYMGSADLMRRNLLRRVEVITRVYDPKIQQELQEVLDACLTDQVLAWEMGSDGRYYRTPTSRRVAARHVASQPGKGKLMKVSAVDGLHEALMQATLRSMKRQDKRGNLANLATKKKKPIERTRKEVQARTLKSNTTPELSDNAQVAIDASVPGADASTSRPNFGDVVTTSSSESTTEKLKIRLGESSE
jgi:polyphosphate kinase